MSNKVYYDVMRGKETNICFSDVCYILIKREFQCRIKGDHYIFTREDIPEIINLQPIGNKAKPYQIKQVRLLLQKYNL